MCLAVPMKIASIEGTEAEADLGGVKRRVRLDLVDEAHVGQYVLVHAGYAISVLDEEDALETLEYLSEIRKLTDEA